MDRNRSKHNEELAGNARFGRGDGVARGASGGRPRQRIGLRNDLFHI